MTLNFENKFENIFLMKKLTSSDTGDQNIFENKILKLEKLDLKLNHVFEK